MKPKTSDDDYRLEALSDLLIQYSLGNFDSYLPISENEDDIDAIIAGVNMLGEELKDVTISRDFLSRIYNSIAEMLCVADLSGKIEDLNEVACRMFDAEKYDLLGKNLFDFISIKSKKKLLDDNNLFSSKLDKITVLGDLKNNTRVKLNCNFTTLRDANNDPTGILLIAEDITDRIATEKLIIRTIVETQEKERNRFASDLHDSLGQQLSGIRFYISALQNSLGNDPKLNQQFEKTLNGIDAAIVELRTICFNLMPRTLEGHTLKFSLNELAGKYNVSGGLTISLDYQDSVPRLSKQFEIACFRIVQEFLNNAIKHGKASKVSIKLVSVGSKELLVELKDNGVGFDVNAIKSNGTGMGLRNIQTRVESYYGSLDFQSDFEEGTKLIMKFPLAFVILQ